jgi:hypothetical protein
VLALWMNLVVAGIECLAPERSDLPISLADVSEGHLQAYRFKEFVVVHFLSIHINSASEKVDSRRYTSGSFISYCVWLCELYYVFLLLNK